MQRLHVDRGLAGPAALRKHRGGIREELVLPGGDLTGVDITALGQLGEGAFRPDGVEGHLGLEGRDVVPARTFRHQELAG